MSTPIKAEIVAVITAAIEAATGSKVVAVRIKRSDAWTLAARKDSM